MKVTAAFCASFPVSLNAPKLLKQYTYIYIYLYTALIQMVFVLQMYYNVGVLSMFRIALIFVVTGIFLEEL